MVLEFCQQESDSSSDSDDGVVADATMTRVDRLPNQSKVAIEQLSPQSPLPQDPDDLGRVRLAIEVLIESTARYRIYEAGALRDIARDALSGESVVDRLDGWLAAIFPVRRVNPPRPNRIRSVRPPADENREQRRKREFAEMQTRYKNNMRSCLGAILGGDLKRVRPPGISFAQYWQPLLETVSAADGQMEDLRRSATGSRQSRIRASRRSENRRSGPITPGYGVGAGVSRAPDKSSIWDPITTTEVVRIPAKSGSAPGLDRITPRAWKAVPAEIRALLFNLLLLAREVPSSISSSRTVFLEKGSMPEHPAPSDYRPLSIGSVVLRQFHKILGKRLAALDIFDERQRGFRPVDGVCDNVEVLSAVLADSRRRCRTVHMACVDLSKAFDTVSHSAVHLALEEAGLPLSFRQYIRACYSNATTTLQLSDLGETPLIQLGRGVKQGDPLSPLLFNLVVDRALGVLSEDVGYRLIGEIIGALAYADDIVLLASTRNGLQENLNRLRAAVRLNGLDVNPSKTTVLSLVASGRDKKVKVDLTPTFNLGDTLLRQCSPVEAWKYLGMTYEGARERTEQLVLGEAIEHLSRAPLKPQQRLRLLRDCLLPRYYHRWIVGSVTAKTLKAADVLARAAVRRWLRLPHDVPVGYFHAPIQAGGLGIPLVRTVIPILKHDRLQRLCRSSLPASRAAADSTYVARQLVWCDRQMRVGNVRVVTVTELRQQLARMLHASCDGGGLKEVASSGLSSHWVSDGAAGTSGADYVHYHHVRANCLPSRARTARGRNEYDVQCRGGCPERETPAHCVQRCFRTHGGRILRHNDLCRRVCCFLRQKGWRVDEELSYSTATGRCRPDLTICRDGTAVVVDAQVVFSEGSLAVAHRRKVEKYRSNNDLADRVADHTGVPRNDVSFTAITISWRGVWSPDSERELRELGLTVAQLRTLTTRVLWGSWLNWKRFNSITSRYEAYARRQPR